DADKATVEDDPLFRLATHVIFSSECLLATTGRPDLADGLAAVARHSPAFLAVSNGPDDILFTDAGDIRRMPVFKSGAVDTFGAGDALHGGFALALAEGAAEPEALRFGAAVAGLKCTRIGGAGGMPVRTEVAALLGGGQPRKLWSWAQPGAAGPPPLLSPKKTRETAFFGEPTPPLHQKIFFF